MTEERVLKIVAMQTGLYKQNRSIQTSVTTRINSVWALWPGMWPLVSTVPRICMSTTAEECHSWEYVCKHCNERVWLWWGSSYSQVSTGTLVILTATVTKRRKLGTLKWQVLLERGTKRGAGVIVQWIRCLLCMWPTRVNPWHPIWFLMHTQEWFFSAKPGATPKCCWVDPK